MPQCAPPIEDVYVSGWTPSTNLYAEIDEREANDGDRATTAADPLTETFIVKFDKMLDPKTSDDHTLTVRLKRTGSDVLKVKISLLNGDEVIASSVVEPTESYADYSLTLTEAQADSIGDYCDLQLFLSAGYAIEKISGGGVSFGATKITETRYPGGVEFGAASTIS